MCFNHDSVSVCVSLCVCVCACVCACVCEFACGCASGCTHVCIYVFICMRVHVWMHAFTRVCMCVCLFVCEIIRLKALKRRTQDRRQTRAGVCVKKGGGRAVFHELRLTHRFYGNEYLVYAVFARVRALPDFV